MCSPRPFPTLGLKSDVCAARLRALDTKTSRSTYIRGTLPRARRSRRRRPAQGDNIRLPDLVENLRGVHFRRYEWRRKPDSHARCRRRRHVLHESRYLGDAHRRCAGQSQRDAMRPRPFRRGSHRSRGRLCTHDRKTCVYAATSGTGLANGVANLHNASRAQVPIVNIIGQHATYHLKFDAPLTSDIEAIARPISRWLHTSSADLRNRPRRCRSNYCFANSAGADRHANRPRRSGMD